MAKDNPKADLLGKLGGWSGDTDKLMACTNAIIATLRGRDDPSEIQFWALCNTIVSLMVIEPENEDFMRAILNTSPWHEFAQARRRERSTH